MKRFIKMILLFDTILLLIAMLFDAFISYRLRQNTGNLFNSWSAIYKKELKNDIIINGNSRAWVQYSPAILDSVLGSNAWNLGIDGSSINRQIIRYNTYCRVQRHLPKLLIQNVDFTTIGITKDLQREQFFPYFFFDRQLMRDEDKYEHFSFAEKYLPCYRYYGYKYVILSALTGETFGDHTLYKGYHGYEKSWDGSLFESIDTVKVADNADALAEFASFIGDVVTSGTKVVFVFAPIYEGVTEKIPDVNYMFDMFAGVSEKYGIPTLNYNDDPISHDTLNFYNATHLNRRGAEAFSRKLAHDIDSLGLYN